MKLKLLSALLVIPVLLFGGMVVGSEDSLVRQYSDKDFDRYEYKGRTIFFHQRMIGEAAVEGDFINYCFDSESEELIAKFSRWQCNITKSCPKVISESEAFEIAGGGEYAKLYYLHPESMIYRPAPENPAWVVWHAREPGMWGSVTVIDAVTSEVLGHGIPPISAVPTPSPAPPMPKVGGGFDPWSYDFDEDCYISMSEAMKAQNDYLQGYITKEELDMVIELWQSGTRNTSCPAEAFIFTGPIYADPCHDGWYEFVDIVEDYLGQMNYDVNRMTSYPNGSVIEQNIGNCQTAIFYEHCHGNEFQFWNACDDLTYPEEIEAWLDGFNKMPFIFLGNCEVMCDTGPGTIVDAFAKGSELCTVIIGYCGMGYGRCQECAEWRWHWEDTFFNLLTMGYTVEEAYTFCNIVFPFCEDCILYYGDGDTTLDEKVYRQGCGIVSGEVRDVIGNLLSGVNVTLCKGDE